jgi:hypothetical protein
VKSAAGVALEIIGTRTGGSVAFAVLRLITQ